MILALAGNPNCGKTTLFNALTGANARTGNFPGVTVTRSTGVCRARPDVTLVDLPGVYALRPFSDEERVTRAYLLGGETDAIISIADATCPARSLYLTLQLLELGVPVVLALNVMDALRAGGGAVDTTGLAQTLGIPVVPVSAALGEGLDTLLDTAVRAAQGTPPDPWRALAPGAVQSCVRTLARVLADEARRAGLPPVFAATQWLDGAHGDHAPEAARQAVARMEHETGLTRGEALPTARFAQVDRLTRFFSLPQTLPGHRRSARIDRVLTGRYTAYPAMAALLGGVCCQTFHVVGPYLSRLLARVIAWLADAADGALLTLDAKPLLRALVREGVFAGVGSVAAFLPVILVLFFFLSLLEDTGYLARVAFVTDCPLRRLGLSGQSAVPLLLGFGCSVPAGPGADDPAHAVDELQREGAGVRGLCRRVFPAAQRLGVSGAVRARHRDGGRCSQAALLHGKAGSSALCHGAAGLSLAGRTQRAAADAAANAGISRAGVHGHPRGEHWRVGAAHVHPGVARSRKCRREPAGRGRANDRAGVSAARLRRLARRDRARDRAAGQGNGAVHARRTARG